MNTTARMNHIIQPDGKTFILAMDHAANFNTLPALTDLLVLPDPLVPLDRPARTAPEPSFLSPPVFL